MGVARDLRSIVRTLHLWLSLGLGVVIVAVALAGAPLVWRDNVDRALNPARYAVTGVRADRTPSAYMAAAAAAAGAGQRAVEAVYPDAPGWPVRVTTRGPGANGKPAAARVVTLDPSTGAVLGVAGRSDTFVGVLHNFHHMLSAPQISGRQIVGWIGIALLVLSLSGLYMWLPRNGGFVRGLRWRRAPTTIANLHHLFGFWLSLPLAIVSLTGIYLAFPRQAHAVMSSVAEVGAPMQHGYGAMPAAQTRLDADGALELALELAPESQLRAVSAPVASNDAHDHDAPVWRIRLLRPATGSEVTITVDDRSGDARVLPPPPAGERAAQWIAAVHEGRVGGPVWAILVLLTGIGPLGFFATGLIMWLRQRAARRTARAPEAAGARLSQAEQGALT
ncbi:MAG: PepSY domain-containing protein [Hyphomicrobiales bacterium]|nr:PepSY domain-containing protein [Hyphomicrobiales bacterium]